MLPRDLAGVVSGALNCFNRITRISKQLVWTSKDSLFCNKVLQIKLTIYFDKMYYDKWFDPIFLTVLLSRIFSVKYLSP